jgi:hypothetical protein
MNETQIARAPLHRTRVALLMRREDGALRVALVDESTGAQFGSIELTERSLDAMQRVVEAALRVRKELALRYPDKPLLYESVGSSARKQLAVREDGARFERYQEHVPGRGYRWTAWERTLSEPYFTPSSDGPDWGTTGSGYLPANDFGDVRLPSDEKMAREAAEVRARVNPRMEYTSYAPDGSSAYATFSLGPVKLGYRLDHHGKVHLNYSEGRPNQRDRDAGEVIFREWLTSLPPEFHEAHREAVAAVERGEGDAFFERKLAELEAKGINRSVEFFAPSSRRWR